MVAFARPLVAAALAAVLAGPVHAQSAATAVAAHPSFDGVWTNASSTKLERASSVSQLVIPKAEADAMEQRAIAAAKAGGAPSDLSKGAFKDANSQAGYNSFWTDPGVSPMKVRGEARSSYITDPADGRIPFRDRSKSLAEPIREGNEYRTGQGAYEGPEVLPLRERCLISQSDGGGPVMLNGLYNNNYEFHLTKDYLVIEIEMVHDVRIYTIYGSAAEARAHHKPSAIMPWLGDSVAWWEGDTLVAETRNVNPVQAAHTSTPLSPQGTVTERFTRIADGELLYQFRVEDPVHYTRPWSGEYSFKPAKGVIYEYACHEGNYSVPGILRGARMKEAKAEAPAKLARR
ncbi:MAG TPA: hypothetical protein VG942_13815 [Hyphomonadaceae bacterium]|nr:hypothetical protein [Hyphomonadaceae bacterium]